MHLQMRMRRGNDARCLPGAELRAAVHGGQGRIAQRSGGAAGFGFAHLAQAEAGQAAVDNIVRVVDISVTYQDDRGLGS